MPFTANNGINRVLRKQLVDKLIEYLENQTPVL